MGLYLCVFRGEEELLGFDAGSYDDFEQFRNAARALDRRVFRRFGTLRINISPTSHWSARAAARLARELALLREELRRRPPRPLPPGSWQERVARDAGLAPASLEACFFDVDGVPLIDRLLELCKLSVETGEPILFQ
jgi:hypothetical protein